MVVVLICLLLGLVLGGGLVGRENRARKILNYLFLGQCESEPAASMLERNGVNPFGSVGLQFNSTAKPDSQSNPFFDFGKEDEQPAYARISFTTCPWTSVKRRSIPFWRKVSFL